MGATRSLELYRNEPKKDTAQIINEQDMNSAGYSRIGMKKLDDAVAVMKQNNNDIPQSWNAWDSDAEVCMDKGDKKLAIKFYSKLLELTLKATTGKRCWKRSRIYQANPFMF